MWNWVQFENCILNAFSGFISRNSTPPKNVLEVHFNGFTFSTLQTRVSPRALTSFPFDFVVEIWYVSGFTSNLTSIKRRRIQSFLRSQTLMYKYLLTFRSYYTKTIVVSAEGTSEENLDVSSAGLFQESWKFAPPYVLCEIETSFRKNPYVSVFPARTSPRSHRKIFWKRLFSGSPSVPRTTVRNAYWPWFLFLPKTIHGNQQQEHFTMRSQIPKHVLRHHNKVFQQWLLSLHYKSE